MRPQAPPPRRRPPSQPHSPSPSWDAAEASGAHGENSLDETSLPQLLQVHAKLVGLCARKGLPPPVVMDADALLADAPGVLAALCAGLGVPMDPAMLSWPAGPKACDGLWAERWYHSAHASEGWPAPHAPLPKPRPMHPRLVPLLRAAIPFYEALRPLAVSATPKLTYPDPRNADLLVWVGAPGKGRLVPRELARLSPFDSAVQGGDAVWEGVRIYRGRVYKVSYLRRCRCRGVVSPPAPSLTPLPPPTSSPATWSGSSTRPAPWALTAP